MIFYKYIGKRTTNVNVKEDEIYFFEEKELLLDYNKNPFVGIIKADNWFYIVLNGLIIHNDRINGHSIQSLETLYNQIIKENIFK